MYSVRLLVLALAMTFSLGLAGCGERQGTQFAGTDITGADFAKDFRLTDHTGAARSLADFRGRVVTMLESAGSTQPSKSLFSPSRR